MSRFSVWITALGIALLAATVMLRAGMTRAWVKSVSAVIMGEERRPIELNVWDFLSPTINEDYGRYYDELEKTFETRHPEVDVVYQFVPFPTYTQKIATAMVGPNPRMSFSRRCGFPKGSSTGVCCGRSTICSSKTAATLPGCALGRMLFCHPYGATTSPQTASSSEFHRSLTLTVSCGISISWRKQQSSTKRFARCSSGGGRLGRLRSSAL